MKSPRRPQTGGRGVRISGGAFRGRELSVPPGVRPTEGRLREALFSIWVDRLPGSRFLDLFAGSGAVGFEAAGRGALAVTCAEADPRALRALTRNHRRLGGGLVEILRLDLPAGLGRLAAARPGAFDLVFADPPYRYPGYAELLAALGPLLSAEGEVAVEHSRRTRLPETAGALVRVDARRYGESGLSFFRLRPR